MIPIQKNLNNKAQIQNKKHQGRDNYQSKKKIKTDLLAQN